MNKFIPFLRPFIVSWLVLACLFTILGQLNLYLIHEAAKTGFLWLVFGLYAPVWVLIVEWFYQKRSSVLVKWGLYSFGAVFFWLFVLIYMLIVLGEYPSSISEWPILVMVIGVSLVAANLFWGLVELAKGKPRLWLVVGLIALLFNVYVVVNSSTKLIGLDVKKEVGKTVITYDFLNGEKIIPLGTIPKERVYYVIDTYGVDGSPGFSMINEEKEFISYSLEEDTRISYIDGSEEVFLKIFATNSKEGRVTVYFSSDVEEVRKHLPSE